jgi:Icc-related predicted phosphoesterase
VHDFKPLIEYVRNLEEKPDIIVYAGDDIRRFCPLPLDNIAFKSLHERSEHPPMLESVCINYECRSISSPSYGFILRIPKGFEIDVKNKLKQIKDAVHFIIQTLEKSSSKSIQVLNNLVQKLPIQIEIIISDRKTSFDEKIVSLIDVQTQLEIYKFGMKGEELRPEVSSYDSFFYRLCMGVDLYKLRFIQVKSDEKYVYYFIPTPDQPEENVFEELAKYSRYGVVAVLGNDDDMVVRAWIRGRKVYELFSSLVKIGPVLFVGLEGSTCGMGPSGMYLESDYKLRLEFVQRLVAEDELIVVVSHTPPKGVLDRAIRYGEESIGSLALRDFVEEEPRVCLVICGHVHSCGGRFETLNNATIVNISSHDDPFSRANIAWITIDEEGKVHVDIRNLPSLVEHIITEDGSDVEEKLKGRCNLSNVEAQLFVSYAKKYKDLFEDLPKLATIKFRYGLPWKLMLMMYERGVKDVIQLNEKVFHDIYPYIPGIYRVHWKKAYAKFMREKSSEAYLMHPLPITRNDKVIVFDTEYNPEKGVLYGFLDLSCGEVQHFWFDEKDKASKYVQLKMKENYIFVHWGGKDKKLLLDELGVNPQTFNLLYFCQTSLVAPIDSTTLKDVHDALCGHVEDGWWKRNFYDIDGIYKLVFCNRILGDPTDTSSRNSLLEANKADIIALRKVLEVLFNLPVKSRTEIK